MQAQYILHARTYGIAVCAGINGSTTLFDDTGEGKTFYRPINEWILPGNNLLTGLIFRPPGGALPDGSPAGDANAYVQLELLTAGADGLPNTDVPPLGAFHWHGVGPLSLLPTPILQAAVAETPVATQLWQQADSVETLEESDRVSMVALVNELTLALATQNQAAVLQLLEYRFDDEARARSLNAAALKSSAINLMKNFAGIDPYPPPLDAALALFTPAAAGKAWHIQRGWMKPAIVFEDQEVELTIEVYASRVAGKWIISRG